MSHKLKKQTKKVQKDVVVVGGGTSGFVPHETAPTCSSSSNATISAERIRAAW